MFVSITRSVAYAALLLTSLNVITSMVQADESLKDKACRSVHLGYKVPKGDGFYAEVKVSKSAPGTYFSVCGFNHGYFGIQQLDEKRKVVIFSIWEPGNQNDQASVPAEKRVKLIAQGKNVRIGRFGNEGTGGQSFLDHDWKLETTYRFFVQSRRDPADAERTQFAAYYFLPEEKEWAHIATFSTLTGKRDEDSLLSGYYSFVEDFRRNKISASQARAATYGPVWVRDREGKWHTPEAARFTGDSNPATNVTASATPVPGVWNLATGGDTAQDAGKLNTSFPSSPGQILPPSDLPSWNNP